MHKQDVVEFVSAKLDAGLTPSQTASALLDACLANDPKVSLQTTQCVRKHSPARQSLLCSSAHHQHALLRLNTVVWLLFI